MNAHKDPPLPSFSVILLAGGIGTRMQSHLPKQFLLLKEKAIALHSFEIFLKLPEVQEIVVVCREEYQKLFLSEATDTKIKFATPGDRRQDSVFSGLQKVSSPDNQLVCIHDSARPAIDAALIRRVVQSAHTHHAAVVGVQVKSTIKFCNEMQMVVSTLNRQNLWEIQTPQVVRSGLLKEAFAHALANNLEVTDDVSLVELLKKPVKVVQGCYRNIKITTPEDMILMQQLIKEENDLLQTNNCI